MVRKQQSNLPLIDAQNEDTFSIDQTKQGFSLYDVYFQLRQKELLAETISFNKFLNSKKLNDLVKMENFSTCKKTLKLGKNGATQDITDYVIDEATRNLIITHYSKEVKQGLISNNEKFDDFYNSEIALQERLLELKDKRLAEQQAKIIEQENRLAIAEPIAQIAIARQENKKNLTSISDTFDYLKAEIPNLPFKKLKEFTKWLVEKGYCYRNKHKKLKPYDKHQDKITFVSVYDDDKEHGQAKFTEYGRNWLFKKFREVA